MTWIVVKENISRNVHPGISDKSVGELPKKAAEDGRKRRGTVSLYRNPVSLFSVLFSVSRAVGMLSQLVINRALGTAITGPKSVSTKWDGENA